MSAFGGYADEQQPLALEAEFDGARRPRAPAEQDPCDLDRYWRSSPAPIERPHIPTSPDETADEGSTLSGRRP